MATKRKRMTGSELRRTRADLEMTQERLGQEIDVDAQTISNWERGVSQMTVRDTLAVRAVLATYGTG